MTTNGINLRKYLGFRTLIYGAVNTGKTRRTQACLEALANTGYAPQTVVLDLAPEPVAGFGGKLQTAGLEGLLYLTCTIAAPRLTGRDADHMQALAEHNARTIDPLLERVLSARRTVLVVNDASLYLQAGDLERMAELLRIHDTAVINAYYGDSFAPAPFTGRERRQVEALAQMCDEVLLL